MPSDDTLDLLTAYALGALEPEEVARVGELLEREPELRALLSELRATADVLPTSLPDVTLPPDLRQKVLDRAVGRTRVPTASPIAPVRRERGLRGWLAGLGTLAAASAVAAAIALGQLGTLRSELERTRAALATQIALNKQVATVAAAAPGAVALRGNTGSGTVLRDPSGQILLATNLPPSATGRVYQLWSTEGATPTSIGTFIISSDTGIVVLSANGAPIGNQYAVTDEPGPSGSSGPTTPPLLSSASAS